MRQLINECLKPVQSHNIGCLTYAPFEISSEHTAPSIRICKSLNTSLSGLMFNSIFPNYVPVDISQFH